MKYVALCSRAFGSSSGSHKQEASYCLQFIAINAEGAQNINQQQLPLDTGSG